MSKCNLFKSNQSSNQKEKKEKKTQKLMKSMAQKNTQPKHISSKNISKKY